MKQLYHYLLLFIVLLASNPVSAQTKNIDNTGKQPDDFFISTYQFHPQLLGEKSWLIDFSTDIPKFFKYFNPKMKKIAPKMSVVVLNEAYFNAHILYGLGTKLNAFANIPFLDLHHYSPMMYQKGVWFGDIQTGIVYGNLLKGSHYLTIEGQINWPTGIYKQKPQILNTGRGAFGIQVGLNGLEHLQTKPDAWQLAYHAYFNYLISLDKIKKGPEASVTFLFRKPFHTKYGYFGVENALDVQYHTPYKAGSNILPMTKLMQLNAGIGGWYEFLNNFYLRLSIPYTIYQNKAFLTKYSMVLQLDYKFN